MVGTAVYQLGAASFSQAMLPASRGKKVPYLPAISDDGEGWLLSPDLPKKGKVRVPVKRPALNTANIFRQLATQQGISLPKPESGTAPAGSRPLAEHQSLTLRGAARLILRFSNNLSAELVSLAASNRGGAPVASLRESGDRIVAWLRQKVPQGDWRGLLLDNGSGLSSMSRMTLSSRFRQSPYAYNLVANGAHVKFYSINPRSLLSYSIIDLEIHLREEKMCEIPT